MLVIFMKNKTPIFFKDGGQTKEVFLKGSDRKINILNFFSYHILTASNAPLLALDSGRDPPISVQG